MSLITNLYADPNALQQLDIWRCNARKNSDGKYVYTGVNNVWSVLFHGITSGCVLAIDFDASRRDVFKIEGCTDMYRGSTTLAGVYTGGNCSLYCTGAGNGVSATVNRIGVYTQDDWNRLRQYGLEWFDGGTMPLA